VPPEAPGLFHDILGGVRAAATRAFDRRVLVALLAATVLLFCHGVFGASHVVAGDGASHGSLPAEHAAHPEGAASHQHGTAQGPLSGHADAAGSYFAVLLVLAGVAIVGLVRAAALAPIRREVFRGSWSNPPLDAGALLPRGPTPQLLQVFRL
jgi:small basic protein